MSRSSIHRFFCSRQTDLNTGWPSWAVSRPVRFRIQSWPDKGCQYCAMFGPSRPDKNITISQAVSLMSSPASPGLFTLTRRVRRSQISGQRNRFGVDKDITGDINPVRWIKLSKLRDLMRSPSHCEMITGACTESDLQHSACFPDNLCIPFPEFGVKICDTQEGATRLWRFKSPGCLNIAGLLQHGLQITAAHVSMQIVNHFILFQQQSPYQFREKIRNTQSHGRSW